MQSSQHIEILVGFAGGREVQERIQQAERRAMVRRARQGRPGVVGIMRLSVGRFMVGMGRKVAGPQRKRERWIDVPAALRTAR